MAHLQSLFPVILAVLLLGGSFAAEDLAAARATDVEKDQREGGSNYGDVVGMKERYEGHRHRRGYKERFHGEKEEEERFHGEDEEEETKRLELDLGEARAVLRSDGGVIRFWSQKIEAIQNRAVGIAEFELEQDGLLLPHYADSPHIAYVLQGRGHMGVVLPGLMMQTASSQPYLRQVKKGDVIAIPKGAIVWWYNDGDEVHRVLCAMDSSFAVKPGRHHAFSLAGGKERHFGSVLQGFSSDALATAWGVDERTIESLLRSQSEVGIVRVRRSIRFPRYSTEEDLELEDRRRWRWHGLQEDASNDLVADNHLLTELHYSPSRSQPDFYVKQGGLINFVNAHKLPALRNIKMSALTISLEKNAMLAPCFVSNAHQLIYVTRGNGRIQVASGDGRNVFDEEVREGSFVVIPQFFPSIKIAGEQGLQWVDLLTSDRPAISFLAGRNSVYRAIPKQILTAAFNVEEHILEELGREEMIIFPERSASSSSRGRRV